MEIADKFESDKNKKDEEECKKHREREAKEVAATQ